MLKLINFSNHPADLKKFSDEPSNIVEFLDQHALHGLEMINEVLDGVEANFDLLLENLWWPGLTMLDNNVINKLLENIHYPNKGFMLDIGHMMNTNRNLKDEAGAVDYIWDVLGNLGDLSKYIKGIHLNSSLSGEYVNKEIQKSKEYNQSEEFYDQYIESIGHILKIDNHIPFTNPYIKKIIQYLEPEYLVYEFLVDTLEELGAFVKKQNKVLELKI